MQFLDGYRSRLRGQVSRQPSAVHIYHSVQNKRTTRVLISYKNSSYISGQCGIRSRSLTIHRGHKMHKMTRDPRPILPLLIDTRTTCLCTWHQGTYKRVAGTRILIWLATGMSVPVRTQGQGHVLLHTCIFILYERVYKLMLWAC